MMGNILIFNFRLKFLRIISSEMGIKLQESWLELGLNVFLGEVGSLWGEITKVQKELE